MTWAVSLVNTAFMQCLCTKLAFQKKDTHGKIRDVLNPTHHPLFATTGIFLDVKVSVVSLSWITSVINIVNRRLNQWPELPHWWISCLDHTINTRAWKSMLDSVRLVQSHILYVPVLVGRVGKTGPSVLEGAVPGPGAGASPTNKKLSKDILVDEAHVNSLLCYEWRSCLQLSEAIKNVGLQVSQSLCLYHVLQLWINFLDVLHIVVLSPERWTLWHDRKRVQMTSS